MSSTDSYLLHRYCVHMKRSADTKERLAFAARLNLALDESTESVPQEGKGRQVYVGKMFGVDQKAARKWLKGEGYPTLEKTIDIAKRLHVAVEWILTGRGDKRVQDNTSLPLAELLNLWWQLPESAQQEISSYAKFLLDKTKVATPHLSGSVMVRQDKNSH